MEFLKITRPKNLIIVALTQLFFQFVIITPAFHAGQMELALNPINLALLIICTGFITAGGNIINDFFDVNIDQINKNKENSAQFGTRKILSFYGAIVLTGGIIALYVAYSIDNIILFLIYPAAVIMLFLYSYRLKHLPLIGNFVVSLFTALVIFILLFAERMGIMNMIQNHLAEAQTIKLCAIGFMSFAFLSNMVREIVKDLEDIEGDRQYNSRTLPIYAGEKTAKIIAAAFLILLLCALWNWPMFDNITQYYTWNRIYLRFILTLPILYFLREIYQANSKTHYHNLSQKLKWYMVAGLLYLPFYYTS